MADKRNQDEIIGITRRHLKKYKRQRKLDNARSKTKVAGGSAVAFGSSAQPGPT